MWIFHSGSELLVHTPAKLNLSLNVLGKRDDGFHELETMMVSIRLYDSLRFKLAASDQLTLTAHQLTASSSEIPTDERNLIHQAAQILKEETQSTQGVNVHLTKRIPSEAGLGGGSSDAAATLVCLNRLWNLNLPSEQLHHLASRLGSDVNFFLDSHLAAECRGRGEKINSAELSRPLNLVIVKPESGLSTGSVFQEWNSQEQMDSSTSKDFPAALMRGDLHNIGAQTFNSLERTAQELNEDVSNTLRQISRHAVIAAGMSGSGTACFGVCHSWRRAMRVAAALKSQGYPQTWAVRTGA